MSISACTKKQTKRSTCRPHAHAAIPHSRANKRTITQETNQALNLHVLGVPHTYSTSSQARVTQSGANLLNITPGQVLGVVKIDQTETFYTPLPLNPPKNVVCALPQIQAVLHRIESRPELQRKGRVTASTAQVLYPAEGLGAQSVAFSACREAGECPEAGDGYCTGG
jgi:hypothetical protein